MILRSSLLVLGLITLAGSAQAQSTIKAGDTPTYSWHSSPFQAEGKVSLEDFRGKPVLVDFWGTHCPPCVQSAVPGAMKLQAQYGDAIQVILCESQGASQADMEAFALKYSWLGNRAIWTTEHPFSVGLDGIPSYALISPSGEVIMTGYTMEDHSKIEKALEEMVKKGSSAPKDADESVAKLYREMDKGNYAKAVLEAQKVGAKSVKEPAIQAAAKDVETAVGSKLDRELERVKWLADKGRMMRAQARFEEIERGVKGNADFEGRLVAVAKLFEGPEVQQKIAAERELAGLEKELFAADLKDPAKVAKKLRKFAESNAGSPSAERAAALAETTESSIKVQKVL